MEDAIKKLIILLVGILFLVACRQVSGGDGPTSGREAVANCRTLVNGMAALNGNMKIPQYFLTENPVKQGGEFDVMQYFEVLDHLSMQPGYALDYVYYYDGMGGYPVLYAYPVGQQPYATEADLEAAGEKANYLDYVQMDDTPDGYFQFALLAMKGNQFYLNWHANYNDKQVVCDKTGVKDIIAGLDGGFGSRIPIASRLRASLLGNVTPSVVVVEQTVEVRLVTFTKWGGFYLTTFAISRSSPHTFQDMGEQNLVPYECGIMF
ncbi:MAG: hypothetical protein ABIF04_07070 [Chloroflexota bacterium]